jgi:hypothetical protein
MKSGDLIQWRKLMSRPKAIGILLKEPILPRYGNYPKRYRVLTANGAEEWVDEHKVIIEVVI